MAIRITLEEAENRLFEKHNGTIKMYDYISISKHALFECLVCGRKWISKVNDIINNGCGCRTCNNKKRFRKDLNQRINELENKISEMGYKLLSGNYINNVSPLLIEFPCGHSYLIPYNVLLRKYNKGEGCNICRKNTFYIKTSRRLQR